MRLSPRWEGAARLLPSPQRRRPPFSLRPRAAGEAARGAPGGGGEGFASPRPRPRACPLAGRPGGSGCRGNRGWGCRGNRGGERGGRTRPRGLPTKPRRETARARGAAAPPPPGTRGRLSLPVKASGLLHGLPFVRLRHGPGPRASAAAPTRAGGRGGQAARALGVATGTRRGLCPVGRPPRPGGSRAEPCSARLRVSCPQHRTRGLVGCAPRRPGQVRTLACQHGGRRSCAP